MTEAQTSYLLQSSWKTSRTAYPTDLVTLASCKLLLPDGGALTVMTFVDDDDDNDDDGPDWEFDLAIVALPSLTFPARGDSIDVGPDTTLLPETTRE